jgi:hypothetical protein
LLCSTPFKLQIKTFKNEEKLDRKIRYCNLQSICCCKQIKFFKCNICWSW